MRLTVEGKIAAGFACALLLLSLIGVVSYRSVVRLRADAAWVEHSHEVIVRLEVLLSATTDAQNGHRGYALTGDESFLEPYLQAARTADADLRRLREMTADNPAQQRRLESLAPLVGEQLAFGREVIDKRRSQGFEAAQRQILTGQGKRIHDRIHGLVDEMKDNEDILLKEREGQAHRSASFAQGVILGGSLLAFGLVGLALLVIRRDFAGRNRAEEALRQSAALGELVELLDLASVMVCGLDDRIERWNTGCRRLYGFTAEEAIGRISHELLRTRFPEPLEKIHATLMAAGRWAGELTHTAADGREVVVATEWALWRDKSGRPTAILKAKIDITERKRAETSLRASESKLQTIVENLAEGLAVSDMAGQLLHFNRSALDMHGYTSLDECRRHLTEFPDTFELSGMDGTPWPLDLWPLARILRGEEVRDLEVRIRNLRAGWRRVFSYGGTLVRDDGGQPTMAVVTMSDITERKRAEEELVQLNVELEERVRQRTDQLQAANKELETFAYSVSHDLKAPLRAIDGYSRLLLEDHAAALDEEARTFLRNVRQSAQTMSELIGDLLTYSRLERRSLRSEALDVPGLVEAAVAERAVEVKTCGAEMRVEVPSLAVRADREGLSMALRNLLGNALKFSRGARPPVIEIGGRAEDGACRLWVKDNGIGFDMKFHDRIFEIFQRLERSEDYEGTGVGLALVRKAMERMGGRAWAESVPGRGATFFLELPR